MKYFQFQQTIRRNVFTFLDVEKAYPEENPELIRVQLSRWSKKEMINRLRRGWYCFDKKELDEYSLAGLFYQPSYLSMETALYYYGLIPDIPLSVTSMTTTTTKKINTGVGRFDYYKIIPDLYWGFKSVNSKNGSFNLAAKEKALLDYLYLRKSKQDDLRLDKSKLDKKIYRQYAKVYPAWVRKLL